MQDAAFDGWKIVVVGAGTMGTGIAVVYALNGFATVLVDRTESDLERAKTIVAGNLVLLVDEALATAEAAERARELIGYATEDRLAQTVADARVVVESVFEDATVKGRIFDLLGRHCPPECILCSNTSASNIFEIAQVPHPERLVITHWFNPPFIMDLVEVVCGPQTSSTTVESVTALLGRLGKTPAVIKQYIPGFIINRLATALMREIGYMVTQGWTSVEDIDAAIRATSGVRYAFEGPIALYDVVGWDLIQTVALDLHRSLCSDPEGGNALAAELIADGRLGLKAGKGAFDYTGVDPVQYMKTRSNRILKMMRAIRQLDES